MSNPDDPRRPDERTPDGTEALPVGPDPTAEWSNRGSRPMPDQPTEQFDGARYTSDPYQAYGGVPPAEHPTQAHPTQAYPTEAYPTQAYPPQNGEQPTQAYPTQAYPPQNGEQPTRAYPTQGYPPPAANPTQAYPTYESYQAQQAAYPTQAYPTYDSQQAPNPTQAYQPYEGSGPTPVDEEKKGPGKGVLIAAFTVAGLLLAAVIGFGVALLGSGGTDSSTASAPTTSHAAAPTTPRPTTPPRTTQPEITPPDLSRIPGGVGEAIGAAGAAVGSVKSNDGSTLILDGIGGSQVTVTTDSSTRVIALGARSVADLKTGETVLVQGDRGSDGTVAARVIISTALPDLGRAGGN
ncbi:hypothetical protein GCM10023094_40560 [Rhodococcus olei]|uniref:DUF5666 domain-containing protein n=1 Tax=Rhodococcus olei TaxID=2161675 RepID=A0ABP8PES3_9NOCA